MTVWRSESVTYIWLERLWVSKIVRLISFKSSLLELKLLYYSESLCVSQKCVGETGFSQLLCKIEVGLFKEILHSNLRLVYDLLSMLVFQTEYIRPGLTKLVYSFNMTFLSCSLFFMNTKRLLYNSLWPFVYT